MLEAIIHETIHEKQDKLLNSELIQYKMLRDVIMYKPKSMYYMSSRELHTYPFIPDEYNANIEAFFETTKIVEEIKKQRPDLLFEKMPLRMKDFIMHKGHRYNLEGNVNLSPVEKFYNITGDKERKEEIISNANLSEYERILFGFPIEVQTKQKILNIKQGDSIENIFKK